MVTIKRASAVVAALLFTLAAAAGPAGSRNDGSRWIQLRESTVLFGVRISPGSYTLRWAREPESENVRIEITHGHDVLATGNGRWIESAQPSPYESLVYRTGRGASELMEIRFQRSTASIRIDDGSTRADAQTTTGTDKD